jgi:hypothetical protein
MEELEEEEEEKWGKKHIELFFAPRLTWWGFFL